MGYRFPTFNGKWCGRPAIYKCIDKALSAGVQVGLKDTFHRPKEPEILADAKAWVVNLACTKPKDHGLPAEVWTLSALVRQVKTCAVDAGFPRLAEVGHQCALVIQRSWATATTA